MDRIETAAAWFRRILAPPLFADQEKARIAGILHAISLAILAVVVIIAIATPFAFERPVQGLSMTGTIALLMLALLFLVWRGRVQLAATIFASGLWLFDTILIYMTGGIDSGVLLGYVVVTVLAGLLLGGRAAILFSVLSAAAGLGMVCAESLGFLPSPLITLTLPAMWLAMAANVVLAAALLYVTMRSLDEALVRARRSARALGRANEGLQREIRERVRAEQQGRQRTAQLEALHQVGLEITAQLDLGALLHSIVSRAVELAGGTIGGFFLYRPEREALEVIVTIGADPTLVGRTVVPGKGLAGNVWQRAEPVIVDDYLHWEGRTSVFDDQYFRGVIGVPVRWGEGALGVLSVASDVPGAFDASDAELLALFATQAAIVLQNARLYDETLRRNRELALLNRVIAASAGSREVEPILEVACRELAQTFGLPQAVAVLVDATGAHLVVVAEYDADGQPSLLGETIAVADAPVLLSLRDKKAPVEVYDAQNDPRLGPIRSLATARDVSSLLLLPLFVEEWVVGGLALGVRELHRFSAQEMALVQRVAEQMSGVLARARLGEEQRHLEAQLRQAQKMEALGRLAGGVAHDFNNLLTVIHLSCRMMERQLHAQDPLLEYVQRIRETGERAIKLTRQLLSFSRREAIRPQPLDLSQVVRDLSQMLQRIIGEDVQLKMALANDLWLARADPSQMAEVIVNLAINGRDAMPGGGVLTIETRNVVLRRARAGAEPGEYVLMRIRDTGRGMDEAVQTRLFEPFFTTKERGEGTGLGLSTVFGIVKQNRGHIEVQSKVGRGTSFLIYLPRTHLARQQVLGMDLHGEGGRSGPESSPPQPVSAQPCTGDETVLLVEDDAPVRGLALRVLESCGYQVLAAADGLQALHLSDEHDGAIHLLLTDVVMPHMSGRELAARLQPHRPEMRVLYMSGYAEDVIARQGVLEPGVVLLSKPFTIESLAERVRAVLDGDLIR